VVHAAPAAGPAQGAGVARPEERASEEGASEERGSEEGASGEGSEARRHEMESDDSDDDSRAPVSTGLGDPWYFLQQRRSCRPGGVPPSHERRPSDSTESGSASDDGWGGAEQHQLVSDGSGDSETVSRADLWPGLAGPQQLVVAVQQSRAVRVQSDATASAVVLSSGGHSEAETQGTAANPAKVESMGSALGDIRPTWSPASGSGGGSVLVSAPASSAGAITSASTVETFAPSVAGAESSSVISTRQRSGATRDSAPSGPSGSPSCIPSSTGPSSRGYESGAESGVSSQGGLPSTELPAASVSVPSAAGGDGGAGQSSA
jgi:hypothetical protein